MTEIETLREDLEKAKGYIRDLYIKNRAQQRQIQALEADLALAERRLGEKSALKTPELALTDDLEEQHGGRDPRDSGVWISPWGKVGRRG